MPQKARMRGQPGLGLFAFVDTTVIQDHMDGPHLGGDLTVQLLQKGDTFSLALAWSDSSINVAAACVKSGKQVHSPLALIFLLEAKRLADLSRKRGGFARTRLQIRLFIDTYHNFPSSQGTRVESADLLYEAREDGIARDGWRESQR